MLVRMLTCLSGARVSLNPRDYVEVSDEIGKAWKEAGLAESCPQNKELKESAKTFTPEMPRDAEPVAEESGEESQE